MASQALQELVEALRSGELDLADPPEISRPMFEEMLGNIPVAEDLAFESIELGGVPALRATAAGTDTDGAALLYLHGGGYVIGSANAYRGLAAELGRAAGAATYVVDYRLAPEHPYPAAVDDAIASYEALLDAGFEPGRIVIAGDSAGGGLALATLVALKERGLAQPAAALMISPWTDLGCGSATIESKADEDPALNAAGLVACADHYLGKRDRAEPLASPVFADLAGIAPLLIQVGSAEILLDDAVRTAAAAGHVSVPVKLEIWPEMFHVWHAFAFMLPEGRDAIDAAGEFLSSRMTGAAE